ncbi:hypothetical protein PFISCL1PPCAC_19193, partial [Pristionchus fissidentatus]
RMWGHTVGYHEEELTNMEEQSAAFDLQSVNNEEGGTEGIEKPSLLSLPNEIIEKIYSQLPFIDQLRMGRVNGRMNEIGATF